jgi:hypothetical protein
MSTPAPDLINSVNSLSNAASPCAATPLPPVYAALPTESNPLGGISTLSGNPGGETQMDSEGAVQNPAAPRGDGDAAPHVLAGMPAPVNNMELLPEAPRDLSPPAAPVPAAPEVPQEQPAGPHVLPGMPVPTV